MNKEKLTYYAALIFCILGGGVLFFIFMKYILGALLPFLIAWGVAFAVRRPAIWICKKTGLPCRITRVTLATLGIILVVALGFLMIWQIAALIWEFLGGLDGGSLGTFIDKITSLRFGIFGDIIPEELREQIASAFKGAVGSLLTSVAEGLTRFAASVPRALIFVIISVIATIYFSLDLENINLGIKKLLPERVFELSVKVKDGFLSVGVKYLKAYSLIMLITFFLMLIGLSVLRVRGAAPIALIIAVLDILPVLGVGTVLVPWSIFSFFSGNTFMGIGLLILLLVNEITRQILEPKIIGKNLNIHPLLTLILLYSGYALFGFAGLILLPLAAVIINILIVKDKSAEVG